MRSTERRFGTAVVAALALAVPAGHALESGHGVGLINRVLSPSLKVNGKPGDNNQPLNPHDRLTVNRKGEVKFTIGGIACTLWSDKSNGNVIVQPKSGVDMAFNGGTTVCGAEAKKAWHATVKTLARLKFAGLHDPVFTVVVGARSSVVRVRRGALIVGKSLSTAVVVGKDQQVAVTGGAASQPTAAPPNAGTQIEAKVVHQVESALPPVTDKKPPTTTFGLEPHDPSSLRSALFTFTAQAGSTFSCTFDNEAFHVCQSPLKIDGPLAPGQHVLLVRATDAAGNVEPKPAAYGWTVDSSRIAFESTRSGNADIWVMDPVADPTGKAAVDVTNDPAGDHDPAWSPDGKRLAFHSDRSGVDNIYVVDVADHSVVQVTHDTSASDTNPTWSPDGLRIAYERTVAGQREIWVTSSDGRGKPTQLTNNPGLGFDANFDPAWSPTSDRIAFASKRDGNYEIYVMDATGQNQTRLTNDPAVEFNPAWSPDGTRIAYHSDINTSSKQIWVMDADGKNAHNVLKNASEDANPAWAPDGNELVFQEGTSTTNLYVVGVDGQGYTALTASGADSVPDWG